MRAHSYQLLLQRSRKIYHSQHNFGLRKLAESAVDTQSFHRIVRFADAGRVDEAEEDAVYVQDFLNSVPSGTGDVRHYGTFFTQKGIQQRALSGVGRPHNGNGNAVLYHIALTERGGQALYMRQGCVQQLFQLLPVGKLHVFLAEVQLQFQQRRHLQELLPKGSQFGRKASLQLVHRHPMRSGSSG